MNARQPDGSIRFGTSGFRGRWGIEFTEAVARDITQAICDYLVEEEELAGKIVVIGYDSREHADVVARWCADVVLQNGFAVHLTSRDTPTPALAYYAGDVLKDEAAGVINCTSSHNPVEWQGIKYSLRDGSISPPRVTDFISARATEYRRGERSRNPGKLAHADRARLAPFDPRESYCRWLLESGKGDCRIALNHERMRDYFTGKPVIVDEMHGTGRGYLRYVLDAIGIPYSIIHGERDPRLGGLPAANPEEPHIQMLKDTVRQADATIGVGLDTDADRYGIVDRGGAYVTPNAVLAMLTRYLGVERGLHGRVATTNVTTHILEHIAADIAGNEAHRPAAGARPTHLCDPEYEVVCGDSDEMVTHNVFTVLTGLKHIIQVSQMDSWYRILDPPPHDWRCRLLIGGEEASGLTTKGHVPDKDGIWAGLLVMDMVAHYRKPLEEIWRDLTSAYHPSYSMPVNLSIGTTHKGTLIGALLDEASSSGGIAGLEVVYAGRIRFDYAEFRFRSPDGSIDNFLHVRPSGTEPLVRVYLETASQAALDALRADVNARAQQPDS